MSAGPTPAPSSLSDRLIAFTTPYNYSTRLSHLLSLRGAAPLPIPTVSVGPTPPPLLRRILRSLYPLDLFAGLAFTSSASISALSLALDGWDPPPLSDWGPTFTVAALGNDADLLDETRFVSKLCANPARIRVLVAQLASPAGMVIYYSRFFKK